MEGLTTTNQQIAGTLFAINLILFAYFRYNTNQGRRYSQNIVDAYYYFGLFITGVTFFMGEPLFIFVATSAMIFNMSFTFRWYLVVVIAFAVRKFVLPF